MYKGSGAVRHRRGKRVRPPFPATICVAVNDAICHGIPSKKETLKEGDIIGIDIGVVYKGWGGDACRSFAVGAGDKRSQRRRSPRRASLGWGTAQEPAARH